MPLDVAKSAPDDEFAEFDRPKKIIEDPFEKYNRRIFALNSAVDSTVVLPLTRKYIAISSEDFRLKVSNFFVNLYTPSDIIIAGTQADVQGFFVLSWRFAINSTLGLFGIFDVANELGLPKLQKNFSDTLGLYGVSMGSYLVLPLIGPSTTRNFLDFPVNIGLNGSFNREMPISYQFARHNSTLKDAMTNPSANLATFPLSLLDLRAKLLAITDDIDASTGKDGDRYTAYKNMYIQFVKYRSEARIKAIRNGLYQNATWSDETLNSLINACIENPKISECQTQVN